MIELIPAIDLIDGKCVRLTQGDYDTKKVYNEDPLEVAKMFEACSGSGRCPSGTDHQLPCVGKTGDTDRFGDRLRWRTEAGR